MEYIKKNKNFILMAVFVIFVSYLPFMNNFLLWGHDIRFHLGRIEGLAEALSNGEIFGRINTVNEYGYASGIMYPQLFLYIPAVLRLLGLPLMDTYKLFAFMINVATFVIAYISFKNVMRLSEKYIAMLAAAFYVLGLYRLSSLYLRAAIGEVLGMAFLPLLLWGMYELFIGKENRWWIAVIGWTCMLQSHILTTEIAMVFSVLFFIAEARRILRTGGRIMTIVKAAVLTVLLNLFFIVPFLHYSIVCDFQVFHENPDEFVRSAVYFSQMFSSVVFNSGSSLDWGTTAGEMPLSIGVISLLTLFGYGMLRLNTTSAFYRMGDRIFLLVILILLAASELAPWGVLYRFPKLYQLAASIQFLFRLLSPAYLFLTILFIINLSVLKDYIKEPVLIVAALLLIMVNCWYYIDSTVQTEEVYSREQTDDKIWMDELYIDNKYSDEKVSLWNKLNNRGEKIELFPAGSGWSAGEYAKKGSSMTFEVTGSGDNTVDIEIPVVYYPTYRAQLNGKDLQIEQGTYGVIRIKNVSQSGVIRVWFPEPGLWLTADIISLCTALFCIAAVARKWLKRHPRHNTGNL